jgi:hypothetical protein
MEANQMQSDCTVLRRASVSRDTSENRSARGISNRNAACHGPSVLCVLFASAIIVVVWDGRTRVLGYMETGENYSVSLSNLYYSACPVVGKSDIRVTSVEPRWSVQRRFRCEATDPGTRIKMGGIHLIQEISLTLLSVRIIFKNWVTDPQKTHCVSITKINGLIVIIVFRVNPEGGGRTFLRKVDKYIPDYTASHYRREQSS